jgi:hypothetical protein
MSDFNSLRVIIVQESHKHGSISSSEAIKI